MKFVLLIALLQFLHGSCEVSAKEFLVGGIQVNESDHDKWIRSIAEANLNTVAVTSYAKQGDWNSDNLWFEEPEPSVLNEIRTAKKANLKVVLILRVALDHAFEENEFLWHGMIMPKTDEQLASWFAKYSRFVKQWAQIAEQESVDVLGIASEMNLLTSTKRIKEVPELLSFYLDSQKLTERKIKLERTIESALKIKKDIPKISLLETFDKRTKKQIRWAKEVSFFNQKDNTRVAALNDRRATLEKHWLKIVKDTRNLFKGKLTYAANFDQYAEVTFWNRLDLMGVNAYFSLRKGFVDSHALFGSLVAGWEKSLFDILSFRKSEQLEQRPLMFTELGFKFRKHSTIEPWTYSGFSLIRDTAVFKADLDKDIIPEKIVFWEEQKIDYEERRLALKALKVAGKKLQEDFELRSFPLSGILYWKLSTTPSHLEIEPFVHILNSQKDLAFSKALSSFKDLNKAP